VRKLVSILACALALGVGLSACGSPLTPYAARVDGKEISAASLVSAMRAVADDPGYRCQVRAGSGDQIAIEGSGPGTYSSSFAADVLTQLVQYQAVHQEIARLGLTETPFAEALAASELPQAFSPSAGSGCTTPGAAVLAAFAPSYRRLVTQFEVDQLTILAHLAGVELTRAGIRAYVAHHRAESALACTSVIEVASRSTAQAIYRRLRAGASFASAARSDSLDASASSGGALGCVFPSEFTAPLGSIVAALPVGQVSQPVAFGADYLLLLVTSRPVAPLERVAAELLLAQQSKASALIAAVSGEAHVTVDPAYGTWRRSRSGWSVQAPSGPADALLPDPAAVTPAAAAVSPSG
jgi:parvulin-like peptidyl-prolyl isomerase